MHTGGVHSAEGGGVPQHSLHPLLERAPAQGNCAQAASLHRGPAGHQHLPGRPHRQEPEPGAHSCAAWQVLRRRQHWVGCS